MDEKSGSNVVDVGVDLSEFYMSVEWDILEVPAVRWVPHFSAYHFYNTLPALGSLLAFPPSRCRAKNVFYVLRKCHRRPSVRVSLPDVNFQYLENEPFPIFLNLFFIFIIVEFYLSRFFVVKKRSGIPVMCNNNALLPNIVASMLTARYQCSH